MSVWFVYILRCADYSLYTGITTDIERRIEEHNSSDRGAKYTRGRRPVSVVYQEKLNNRSEALKREAEIKKLNVKQKQDLIALNNLSF